MKKTKKKIFGSIGFAAVVAITAVAIMLPEPGASATTSSVTDTIVVRVVRQTPNVDITGPDSGEVFVTPNQAIDYSYENVNEVTITLEYTDKDGNVTTKTLASFDAAGQPGSGTFNLNLGENDLGYGEYKIRIRGVGSDGVDDDDVIEFSYYPVVTEVSEDPETGDGIVDLEYDENNPDIETIIIRVYDKDGNLVTPLSPITVTPPDKTATIPFGDYDLPEGRYLIATTAYNGNGEELYTSYDTYFIYKPKKDDSKQEEDDKKEDIPVPGTADTGGMFGSLNISKVDYLVTGMIMFTVLGIGALYFVIKDRKDSKKN